MGRGESLIDFFEPDVVPSMNQQWGHGVLLYPLWHWKTLCSSTYAAVSERAAHDLYLELNAEQHTAHREQLSRSNEATRESICSLAQTFLGEEASQLVEDSLVLIETFAIHFGELYVLVNSTVVESFLFSYQPKRDKRGLVGCM